ncbi:hypothetical protein Vadar_013981 [Vaccinium darrowii]|uniref:Uncharacterized protein n=1 Tax=Vaccinium darrowii TaxID=229202 RepID=A0ACB7XQI9_9ERIC|nr:hypothetical protein Vadar_013981 [Vaccinium darrowii]
MVLCYLVAAMAFLVTGKHRLLALSLIAVFLFNGKFGKAVFEVIPSNGAQSGSQSGAQNGQFGGQTGGSGQFGGQTGGSGQTGQFGGQTGGSAQNGGQFGGQTGGSAQNGGQFGGQTGGSAQTGGQFGGQAGGSVEDPTAIVTKALLCFHDNYVYSSCEESYRLTESGELHVPPEYTEQYCNGPCITETHLVLNCVGDIMTHFEFYNKATIQEVSETIKEGCGYGSQRGNFNVAEHIQEGSSNREKITTPVVVGVVLMILVQGLLF